MDCHTEIIGNSEIETVVKIKEEELKKLFDEKRKKIIKKEAKK